MKTIILVALFFSAQAFSIVPNTKYYELAQNRIAALESEVATIESELVENKQNKIGIKLKDNLKLEIELIKQRVQLYKKLEEQSLIMYSTP